METVRERPVLKFPKGMTLDEETVIQLRDDLQSHLDTLSKRLGVELLIGKASYFPTICTFELHAGVLDKDGNSEIREVLVFKQFALEFGFTLDDLYKTFQEGNNTWEIIGLRPRCYEYPVVCRNQEGKCRRHPLRQVWRALAAAKPKGRSEADILADLRAVECALLPKNLERRGVCYLEVQWRSEELNRRKQELFAELGREPTSTELCPEASL